VRSCYYRGRQRSSYARAGRDASTPRFRRSTGSRAQSMITAPAPKPTTSNRHPTAYPWRFSQSIRNYRLLRATRIRKIVCSSGHGDHGIVARKSGWRQQRLRIPGWRSARNGAHQLSPGLDEFVQLSRQAGRNCRPDCSRQKSLRARPDGPAFAATRQRISTGRKPISPDFSTDKLARAIRRRADSSVADTPNLADKANGPAGHWRSALLPLVG